MSSLEILVEIAQVIVQSADLTIEAPHSALRQPFATDFAVIGIVLLRIAQMRHPRRLLKHHISADARVKQAPTDRN